MHYKAFEFVRTCVRWVVDMVKIVSLQVRLTKAQHQSMKELAEQRGFRSLADYVRHMALRSDFSTQEKITELHHFLLGDPQRNGKSAVTRRNPLRC